MAQDKGMKSLAKDTVVYGLTNIISKFLNWLLAPLYIRVLATSAEYGIVTNLYAWVSVILVVLTLGLETGLFRFINTSDEPQRVYATCLKVLCIPVVLFLILGLSQMQPIADFLKYPDHPEYIGMFVVIVALDALMSLPFAYLRYKHKPWRFAFYKFLFIGLNILFNLFFLVLCPHLVSAGHQLPTWLYQPGMGVGYIFISNLLASGIEALMMLPLFRHGVKGFDRSLIRKLALYCGPLVLLGLAGDFNKMAGQVLIPYLYEDHMEGMTALGIFGGNLKISVIMVMFLQAFRFAYDPFVFSKMKSKDAGKAYRDAMTYFILFATIIFVGVMYWIDVFKIIVRPDYYSGLIIVPWMMMSEILFGIYYNLSVWYKVTDRTYFGALFAIIGLIVTLTIIVLGVPRYGFIACAWAAVSCNLVMLLLSYFLGQHYHPIDYRTRSDVGILVLGLLFYFGGMLIHPESLALRLVLRTLLVLVYAVVASYLFMPALPAALSKIITRKK
jgi:O-antigen/teichoic acid export membrane protein